MVEKKLDKTVYPHPQHVCNDYTRTNAPKNLITLLSDKRSFVRLTALSSQPFPNLVVLSRYLTSLE